MIFDPVSHLRWA